MNRYDFVYLFDITDGNPNGDPDAGNLPRIDAETGQGLVTDVCIKRKIRNYVSQVHGPDGRYRMFVRDRSVLNDSIEEAYFKSERVGNELKEWGESLKHKKKSTKPEQKDDRAKTPPVPTHIQDIAARWLCDNFFDIRFFGAVLNTGTKKDHPDVPSKIKMTAGQVRGPIQFAFARSIDPIVSAEHAITRCAVTTESDAKKKDREMGRKFTIPYGLYRAHGYVNPLLADGDRGTGFDDADLNAFKKSLNEMFEYDRSAAQGNMKPCHCIAFRHENPLGNARADQLFSRISVELKPELREKGRPGRAFCDYNVAFADQNLPSGVSVEYWV